MSIQAIETLTKPTVEASGAEFQDWLKQTISNNWETAVAGGLFFVLVGSDVIAISRDVLADGKLDFKDPEDLLALARGTARIVGSFVGAGALQIALTKNPMATLSTLAAGMVAAVGISKTADGARNVVRTKGVRAKFAAMGGAASTAVLAGAAAGVLEMGALMIDKEAWLFANAGMAVVAMTRPKETAKLIGQVRDFLATKK